MNQLISGHDILVMVMGSILATIGFLLMKLINEISLNLNRLTLSVEALNINVATIIERTDGHEKRITRLEAEKEN